MRVVLSDLSRGIVVRLAVEWGFDGCMEVLCPRCLGPCRFECIFSALVNILQSGDKFGNRRVHVPVMPPKTLDLRPIRNPLSMREKRPWTRTSNTIPEAHFLYLVYNPTEKSKEPSSLHIDRFRDRVVLERWTLVVEVWGVDSFHRLGISD